MPADENQITITDAALRELQIILDMRRPAVLISAQQRDVETEARILEIIRVAAEKRRRRFRREDNPDQRLCASDARRPGGRA